MVPSFVDSHGASSRVVVHVDEVSAWIEVVLQELNMLLNVPKEQLEPENVTISVGPVGEHNLELTIPVNLDKVEEDKDGEDSASGNGDESEECISTVRASPPSST